MAKDQERSGSIFSNLQRRPPMKLRIKGNTIRLRLSPSEFDAFVRAGRVEEAVAFAGGRRLVYALEAVDGATGLTARLDDAGLTLSMPTAWVSAWANEDRVGYESVQPVGEGESLHLLVEKDFQCLHRRPDEEDAFPHPQAGPAA